MTYVPTAIESWFPKFALTIRGLWGSHEYRATVLVDAHGIIDYPNALHENAAGCVISEFVRCGAIQYVRTDSDRYWQLGPTLMEQTAPIRAALVALPATVDVPGEEV